MLGLGIAPRLRQFGREARRRLAHLARPRLVPGGRGERVDVIFSEPHDMPMGDRIVLYGLVRGLKPATYLEIGVRWGGSARIVANAMEANGFGQAVGLDPDLSNFRPGAGALFGRYATVEGYSPEDTPKAAARLDGPIELAFIDAVHTYSAVKSDLAGVAPLMAPGGHVLFHDAFHQGINEAVDEFLRANPDFVDLGMVSRNASVELPVSYFGLRLIRKGPLDFAAELGRAHARDGTPMPALSAEVWDHDPYAERMGNPLGRPDA
ncbi:MAG: class I SAM-dependent methyltransferase [Pseudomonadota bacterium]